MNMQGQELADLHTNKINPLKVTREFGRSITRQDAFARLSQPKSTDNTTVVGVVNPEGLDIAEELFHLGPIPSQFKHPTARFYLVHNEDMLKCRM